MKRVETVLPADEVSGDRGRFRGPIEQTAIPLERRVGHLPADFVALVYLVTVVTLIALGRGRLEHWGWWLGAHLAALGAVILLRFVPRQGLPLLQMLRETYGLCLMPVVYGSVSRLNRILYDGYFDDTVLRWDQRIFGTHLHEWLGFRYSWPPLSEFLHLAYILYILLVPTLALTLFFQRRFEALRAFATTQMLTMYGCYLIFIFFPVQGPWHTYPHHVLPDHAFFPRLVHAMLEAGGSQGTAFPSSHVAGATTVVFMAFRFSRRLGYVLTGFVVSIAVATVYGGFHYAIDATCGLIFGVAVALVGPRLHSFLLRRIRLAVIHLRFPSLRFRWRNGRIRGEVVRPKEQRFR